MDRIKLYNKFFSQVDKSEEEILSLIKSHYDEGYQFVKAKRVELQANLEYYKASKEEGEAGDETCYQVVNSVIARSITEEARGEFESSSTRDKIITDNLTNVFTQDVEDDDMLAVDVFGNLFKNIMGVYIKVNIGWNGKKKANIFNYVDPRIWIPDPNGNYATGQYAYSGFETFVGDYAIEDDYLNREALFPFKSSYGTASEQKFIDQQTSNLQGNNQTPDNKYYDIYHHYFYIRDKKGNNRKAYVIVGNDKSLILHIEIYDDISEEIEAEFPFSFEYYGFEEGNPFGDNLIKHIANIQDIKKLMRNLRIKKSKAELYPMYFYNEKYIDKNKLSFGFNKFIPVNTKLDQSVNLDAIITSFKPDSRADNSYIIDQDLDRQVEKSTSIGSNIQGATQEGRDTATEISYINSNTDINLSYREKIANIGKKQFMKVWLQGYIRNFEEADTKIVMLYDGIGSTPIELRKKDFITSSYFRINLRSKTQVEMRRRKEVQSLSQIVNIVMSMDSIDSYQKLLFLRDFSEALGYSKNKILSRLSGGPEEELIKNENEILENGAYLDTNPTDNHFMHIMLQKPSQSSNIETITHYQNHITQWIQSGKQITQNQGSGVFNSMQASIASQNTAQLNKQNPIPITNQ